jgi:hypothetical protein
MMTPGCFLPGIYRVDSIAEGIACLEMPVHREEAEPTVQYVHLPVSNLPVPLMEGDFLRYSPAEGWNRAPEEAEQVRRRVRSKLDSLRRSGP